MSRDVDGHFSSVEDAKKELTGRINRGLSWLDANVDEWWKKVELQSFDMSSTCACVLGFVYAEKATEHARLQEWPDEMDGFNYATRRVLSQKEAIQYGFDLDDRGYVDDEHNLWEILSELWDAEIAHRQGKVGLA